MTTDYESLDRAVSEQIRACRINRVDNDVSMTEYAVAHDGAIQFTMNFLYCSSYQFAFIVNCFDSSIDVTPKNCTDTRITVRAIPATHTSLEIKK